MTVCI
jgi:hypothetical protein